MTIEDPTSDKDAARRAAILHAAAQVLFERGFEATTTAEIARRAKTSKSALYELFGSKEGIVTAIIQQSAMAMHAPLDLPSPESREQLFGILTTFGWRFLAEILHPHRTAMYRLAISEAQRSGQIARELEESGRLPVNDAINRLLVSAARAKLIRSRDIELITAVYFGVLLGGSHVRLLLGVDAVPDAKAINARVRLAVEATSRIATI